MRRVLLIAACAFGALLPVVQADAHATKAMVTLEGWFEGTTGGPSWVGQVKSSKACEKNRQVSLYRKLPGKDDKIGTDPKARDNGENQTVWAIKQNDPKTGLYYAKLKQSEGCKGAKSDYYNFDPETRRG
jgi:hypothetical protein